MEYRREPVKGFEEYSIDTHGIVYSKYGRPLKFSINHNGYAIVNFYVNHKRYGFSIHTLVAKQFIPNDSPAATQVNHKNGKKTDNDVKNLEWMTPKENAEHSINVLGNMQKGAQSPFARPIYCYSLEGCLLATYPSMRDAVYSITMDPAQYKSTKNGIWRALKQYRNSYHSKIWRYERL